MSELEELVARPGVLMAGRIGSDGRVAEYKSKSLYVANPAMTSMAQWFIAAITMTFNSMAYAVDSMNQSGFNETSWLPQKGWTYTGGDYTIAVHGDLFAIGERAKLENLDELASLLLRAAQS